nr:ras-like GTP-binding protein RhoL [Aedes albopictus]
MSHDMLNIVVVGDGTVGKTCLLHAYTDESFKNFYQPTIYDKESIEMTLDGQRHTIQLHDTAGQEDYDRIRQQFIRSHTSTVRNLIFKDCSCSHALLQAHCFMLCYSIDKRVTYENITSKWIPELTAEKRIPIVLIATKLDLRKDINTEVSTAQGERLKRTINANSFVECSAKQNINVKLAVEEAVRACFQGVPEPEKEDRCCGLCSIS